MENYKNGQLDGLCTRYYENGQLVYEKNYENGKWQGKWQEWDRDGNLTYDSEERERKRVIELQKLNDYNNKLNKSSTSNNIDGWYSYEDQTSTYRLTVSNGRWSYSTAIKISGVAQTDQSSGIERNGVLYMGGANVGYVDGNCAQVGSSPQMCKQ